MAPIVTQHQRLAVCCPSCGTRVIAPSPEAARGTPFGPRLHAVATYLKTFQALSYERLQAALSDLFGLTLSQGGLMNLLHRAQGCFRAGRDAAIATLRKAEVVACDETGVRIEGSNAYHWLFHSAAAVVHTASPTRGAVVVREMMDGHRPAVWISDRYTAQQGHADEHQTCLAHLARDVAYVVEVSDDPVPWRLQLWLGSVFALAERVTHLAASTLSAKRRSLDRQLGAILATSSRCDLTRELQAKISRARDQLLVAARNRTVAEAQSRAFSGARSVRLETVSDAHSVRLGARSVRPTRDHPSRRTLRETDQVGRPAARISSRSSAARAASSSPRRSRRTSPGLASNCSARLRRS